MCRTLLYIPVNDPQLKGWFVYTQRFTVIMHIKRLITLLLYFVMVDIISDVAHLLLRPILLSWFCYFVWIPICLHYVFPVHSTGRWWMLFVMPADVLSKHIVIELTLVQSLDALHTHPRPRWSPTNTARLPCWPRSRSEGQGQAQMSPRATSVAQAAISHLKMVKSSHMAR